MENASKALLMAAEILIGVLIISVGVALFNSFAGSSKNIIDQIEANKLSEFNGQFYKYYGQDISAHDVITIANLAKSNNKKNQFESQIQANDNLDYIQVKLLKKGAVVTNNLEAEDESYYINFLKENVSKDNNNLFACTNIQNSNLTGRVICVTIDLKK